MQSEPERALTPEMTEEAYTASRDRLVEAIGAADEILRALRAYTNGSDDWVARYPESAPQKPLSVLRLDLSLGGTAGSHGGALVQTLDSNAVARLLDERVAHALSHLGHLRTRITDTQSKVLVTGDLNSGKSTLVNALLRRHMVPTDQQPCTMGFCEVLDARENNGKEAIHVLNAEDASEYTEYSIDELERIFCELEEADEAPAIRVYVADAGSKSVLHGGALDIALIDAPGLNRDSVKTTAVFAREERIDVVVFVVSAENHFTLSAQEFLENAGNEKAYVFVVVNKFAHIRNKDKCRRLVLEQLRELSPRTYANADELVHFVDAEHALNGVSEESAARFHRLEGALRDFVLHRRASSKLQPAQNYLLRLLGDVVSLAELNAAIARAEAESARATLADARPALAACEKSSIEATQTAEATEDAAIAGVQDDVQRTLSTALETLSHGKPAHASVSLPEFPGILNLYEYAQDVRYALAHSLRAAVYDAEDAARDTTGKAVAQITALGDHLGEAPRRFMPSAMFARAPTGPLNFAGLGIDANIVSFRLTDVFDVAHHIEVIGARVSKDDEYRTASMSLGLGALTLAGTRSLGLRSGIDIFVRLTDLLSSRAVRRWAGPVLLLASAGLVAWVVADLPNAVPRNVGRSLRRELTSGHAMADPGNGNALMRTSSDVFSAMNGARIARETRKVLRISSWDLQERFRVAISSRRDDVHRAEAQEKCAALALAWFYEAAEKSASLSTRVEQALTA